MTHKDLIHNLRNIVDFVEDNSNLHKSAIIEIIANLGDEIVLLKNEVATQRAIIDMQGEIKQEFLDNMGLEMTWNLFVARYYNIGYWQSREEERIKKYMVES